MPTRKQWTTEGKTTMHFRRFLVYGKARIDFTVKYGNELLSTVGAGLLGIPSGRLME